MQNYESKNLNNEKYKNIEEEKVEIIIELEIKISDEEKEKEIYILCDKSKLIEDNKLNEEFYKKNKINPPKEFDYFNKFNTKLYLNDKEMEFNYKLNFFKNGINKIKIISNKNLFTLSSMFYNCYYIHKINF